MSNKERDGEAIVSVLRAAGLDASGLSGLGTQTRAWKADFAPAVLPLAELLPSVSTLIARLALIDALGGPWAGAAVPALIAWVRTGPELRDRWAAGASLERMRARDLAPYIGDLLQLVRETELGSARQRVVVAAAKVGGRETQDVLLAVLDEPDLSGHALEGLRKMRAAVAPARLEPFVTHEDPWVRRAARALMAVQPSETHPTQPLLARMFEGPLRLNRLRANEICGAISRSHPLRPARPLVAAGFLFVHRERRGRG